LGPRRIPLDSIGGTLLALIGSGMLLSLWRPGWFPAIIGLIFAVAIAGNTAASLNHPTLVEMMDQEYEERQQMANFLHNSPEPLSLTNIRNGRYGLTDAPASDEQRGDIIRGWNYLLYGVALVAWCG